MPSKKRKYNARFPAGRIKKIMQTDEEVGKVAQAVPIIISRTLELFVESLLSKAMQVTAARNAKTLSPSHVKQCILAESRFDFLKDLVKNIPDVSAAEEKEMQMSAESSPNSSRFSDTSAPARKVMREDSNSSSSCDVKIQQLPREGTVTSREALNRALSADADPKPRVETATSAVTPSDAPLALIKKNEPRTANFYHETLVDEVQHKSVITVNPTYTSPQPSTSSYARLPPIDTVQRIQVPSPAALKPERPFFYLDLKNNVAMTPPRTPATPITPLTPAPVTPILNIDFSKNIANPEIKLLDTAVANIVGVKDKPKLHRQISRAHKSDSKRDLIPTPANIDHMNSGNLQIDEDYDT